MLYLIWGLLNLGLMIYFLVICFKATKLVKEKIGLFAAVIFVLGLLSFSGQPTKGSFNKGANSNKINSYIFASEVSLSQDATFFVTIDLENNWVSKKDLGIKYGNNKQGQINIPISAYSSRTGFISGTIWRTTSINVNRTVDNNKFQYSVIGMVDWKLLGATIYTQLKRFDGIASIK